MTDSISQKMARRLLLHAQLFDGRTRLAKGGKGVAQAVEHLGYVQIDTIAVIERAHHHTLWNRIPGYEPKHLHEALAIERTIFEYWGHAASYLPMKDYRFYMPMMRSFFDPKNAWFRGWGEKYGAYLGPVLERIRAEGPLAARDFENPGGKRKGQWWGWKPAKAALELLFWRGELMVRERRGFERVYDLAERVLPTETATHLPAPAEMGRFIVRRALAALGVACAKEIRDYIRIGDKDIVAHALQDMLAGGEIASFTADGQAAVVYALPEFLAKVSGFRAGPPRVRLLSPFDNLAIYRPRLQERFGFDYAFECYVPRHKRNHGYFVLPVLFGENIVGRLDPKAERKSKTFIVHRLDIEPGFNDFDRLAPELGRALSDFARFNGCQKVVFENVRPEKLLAPLKRASILETGG